MMPSAAKISGGDKANIAREMEQDTPVVETMSEEPAEVTAPENTGDR